MSCKATAGGSPCLATFGRLAIAMALVAGLTWSARAGACEVAKVGEAPLLKVRGHYEISAVVNGSYPMDLLLDTGAETSSVPVQAATQLQLPARPGRRTALIGVDGTRGPAYPNVTIERLAFAGLERTGVAVALRDRPAGGGEALRGVLGADLLSAFDLELDFANARASFFRVSHCARGDERLRPWSPPYDVVALRLSPRNMVSLPVVLDGTPLEMVLDTGSTRSSVPMDTAAAKLGVDVEGLKAAGPRGTHRGSQGGPRPYYAQRFKRVAIGPRAYRNIEVHLSDLRLDPYEGLLGLDFLRSRKVWLSYATHQMFVAPGH